MADAIFQIRVSGSQSFARAVDEVDAGLRRALSCGARRVLVDVCGVSGFSKPDVAARLRMVRRWAATAQGRLRMAMISPRELNDGDRFDVVVAHAVGFDGDVFETEEDARRWLDELPGT